MRRVAVSLSAVAMLAAACSGAPEETEVLGVVLEATPTVAATEGTPYEAPEWTEPLPATGTFRVEHEPESSPAPEREPSAAAPRRSTPEPEPEPSPSFTTWVVPDGHVGEAGTVWTVERDDCGAATPPCWVETSSTQIERGAVPAVNPLRVSLADVTDPEAPTRDAICAGGLHADDEVAIDARGTIILQLLVDGEVVATSRTTVDVLIEPGSGIAAAELAGPVEVSLSDTDRVGCAVRFEG